MKSKKLLSTIVAGILSVSVIATGCSSKTTTESGAKESTTKTSGQDAEQKLTVILGAEPKTLDASKASDLYSTQILQEVQEGLTRVEQKDGKDVVAMAGAEKYEKSADGLTWTFTLRDNKWSDGQPVKAADYEYAVKRTLDPAVASKYSFLLYPIKGAQAYNSGKGSADAVGVKAVDDKHLQFTLEAPTPYFLELTYFKVMFPQRKDFVESKGDKYGTEASNLLFTGPFVMKEWAHGDKVTLVKNDNYWDKDSVKLSTVNMRVIKDVETAMQELEAGNVDTAGVSKTEWVQRLNDTKKFQVRKSADASASYAYFNQKVKLFSNAKVRKAFSLATNRDELVKVMYKDLAAPAYGWIPPLLQIGGEDFRTKVGVEPLKKVVEDNKDPKALLVEGLKELGLDPDPSKATVTYLVSNATSTAKENAELVQQQWQKALGVKINIEYVEWAVFSTRTEKGEYEVASAGWSPDYNDPMTDLDMWESTAGIVPTGWKNEKYDALIAKARATEDQKARLEIFKEAEKMVVADEAVIAPWVYRMKNTYTANYVKNYMTPLFGSGTEFKYAYTDGRGK
jgi:oligopeptide transport system substrate-binding protein